MASLKRTVLAHFLFGDSGQLIPEFDAFASGFNYRIKDDTRFSDVSPSFGLAYNISNPYLMQLMGDFSSKEMLVFMYNRRVEEPEDVHRVLQFMEYPHGEICRDPMIWTRAHSRLKERLISAFEYQMTRYVIGTGHPNHASIRGQIVDDDQFAVDEKDGTLRARLLLSAVTGVDLLPTDPGFKIKVGLRCLFVS